jgi:hypothetical protein
MIYSSNAREVITGLITDIKGVDILLEDISDFIYTSIKRRVFVDGKDVNNSNIGKYSLYTKRIRQKKGLQTNYVNLVFEGNLLASFSIKRQGSSYLIGFDSMMEANIAAKNEDRFGKTIFGLTSQDESTIDKMVEDWVKKINK